MMAGRLLIALGLLAFAAFAFQRGRSPFLRIEADAEQARVVADATGLEPLEVMALRDLIGVEIVGERLLASARAFAADRGAFGSADLAAVAAAGHREVAERVLEQAGGDPRRAEELLRPLPEAIWAVRMRAVRDRFASRQG